MRLLINGVDLEISQDLCARVQERVCLVLLPFQRVINWVSVEFTPSALGETCCQVDVWLHGIGAVTVRHSEMDPMEAADMAALRLREAVRRRLARRGNPHLHPRLVEDRADPDASPKEPRSWASLTWPKQVAAEVSHVE